MPKKTLYMKCHMFDITRLYVTNPEKYEFCLKIQCANCKYGSEKAVFIIAQKLFAKPHSRGNVNHVFHCKKCKHNGSIDVLATKTISDYTGQNQEWQPIVTFDFRGAEPVEFVPRMGWSASSKIGTEFGNVDLNKEMWTDFDRCGQSYVEIGFVETKFER